MYVIRPLETPLVMELETLLLQLPSVLFIISLIAELNISRSVVRFICSLNFLLWVSGKHLTAHTQSWPQYSSEALADMNNEHEPVSSEICFSLSWQGGQRTKCEKKMKNNC